MKKHITKNEYVLTNLHPNDRGYYIRLKDNIEYQLYMRKLKYFIKKNNEEYLLDKEVKKRVIASIREYERYGI